MSRSMLVVQGNVDSAAISEKTTSSVWSKKEVENVAKLAQEQ